MNDQETIKQAYSDTVAKLFGVLFQAYVAAPQDEAAQDQAKQRFSSGLSLARKVRDTALSLL